MMMQNIMRGFLDALYPPICLICGQFSHGTHPHCCRECLDSFELVGSFCCELCGEPFASRQVSHLCLSCLRRKPPFNWCRGVYLYRGAVAEAILRFKYRGQIPLQVPLEEALARGACTMSPLPEFEFLIPVPMSRKGLWERGFNQSYTLAGLLARQLDLKILTGAVVKRGNRTQVGLAARERNRNAAVSFAAGNAIDLVKGRRVLLFDDVYTTGATVRACARILGRAGSSVSVLTLARACTPYVRGA